MAEGSDVPGQIIAACRSVVLVDWPSREVPETLAWAGWTVHVKGGPGPDDFSVWEIVDGSPVSRPTGRRPEHVDLVYVHRPVDELPGIVAIARELGARALWYESGSPAGESTPSARSLAEAAGLLYVDDRDIVEAVRSG
jgi:predicted CoA-binding protein